MARAAMTPTLTLAALAGMPAACTADPGRAVSPARRQVRRTSAPWLLGLALLLQRVALLR